MKLKNDIRSMFHGVVYAKAGEEVKVIATHGHVLIVESKAGSRFSIQEADLTDNYVGDINPEPIVVEDKTMKKQSTRKKAAVINNKQTLF